MTCTCSPCCCVRLTESEAENTELRRRIAELEYAAVRDSLTGLYRRDQANRILQSTLAACSRSEVVKVAALFIDLDHFKQVNDTFGHAGGDVVLSRVGRVLQVSVRDVDVVTRGRMEATANAARRRRIAGIKERRGGEEFLVILLNVENIAKRAERLRTQIESLRFRGFPSLRVTTSIGVSEVTVVGGELSEERLSQLVQRADTALYAAKEGGRNRVVHFSDLVARQRAA